MVVKSVAELLRYMILSQSTYPHFHNIYLPRGCLFSAATATVELFWLDKKYFTKTSFIEKIFVAQKILKKILSSLDRRNTRKVHREFRKAWIRGYAAMNKAAYPKNGCVMNYRNAICLEKVNPPIPFMLRIIPLILLR